MSVKTVEVSVDESIYDVIQGIGKFVAAMKANHALGMPAEITADIVSAYQDLYPLVAAVGQIPAEIAADKVMAVKTVNLAAYDLVEAIITPAPVAAPAAPAQPAPAV